MCDTKARDRHGDDCDCYDCVEARMGRKAGSDCRCDEGAPREMDVVDMWREAFRQAYHEVQVELLKAKIKAATGKTMEKAAAAVVNGMIAEMSEKQRRTSAEQEMRAAFEKLISDAGKK